MGPMLGPASFEIDATTPLRVATRSGSVKITGEDRQDILVESGAHEVARGHEGIEVTGRSGALVIRCPVRTDAFVGCASGVVSLQGSLGTVRVTTRSGSITIERAHRVDARTASGDIKVESCDEECRCQTKSGRLRVGRADSGELVAASGSIEVDAIGAVRVRIGSGNVTIGLTEPAPVDVETHSASVTLNVPTGLRPALELRTSSGQVRCDCEPGSDGVIRVRTRSGQISVIER
jgi:DUF4097 and DUF4098 domain-containing protein YvlB